jgi:hypothetical protein
MSWDAENPAAFQEILVVRHSGMSSMHVKLRECHDGVYGNLLFGGHTSG